MSVKNFRGNIVRCSNLLTQFFLRVKDLGSSEVDNFYLIELFAGFEKDILGFQISVYDVVSVAVADTRKQLF